MPIIRHMGRSADSYEQGVHFVTTAQQSVPARYIDPKGKNSSRIYYKLAELEATRIEPAAMALLTDERAFVTEDTVNNFFTVCDGQILTPNSRHFARLLHGTGGGCRHPVAGERHRALRCPTGQ